MANNYGFEYKTKWMLLEVGPLTASGKNEIIATAQYKEMLEPIRKELSGKAGPNNAQYKIVRMEY